MALDAYSPRSVGTAGCEMILDQVLHTLTTQPPEGIRVWDMEWGEATFEREADMFRRRATLHCAAAFVAIVQEETGLLLDFRLKGEVCH